MSNPSSRSIWLHLLTTARWADAPAVFVGGAVSWLILPLIAVIIFDALTRRFIRQLAIVIDNNVHYYLNSPVFQESEWHMHSIILLCALGFAYSRNVHVRLDVFRPSLGARGRLWVELLGGIVLLVPFVAILCIFGWEFFESAWVTNEGSGETNGIENRWFVKSFMFLGPIMLLSSGLSMIIRLVVRLFGPHELTSATDTDKITDSAFTAFD